MKSVESKKTWLNRLAREEDGYAVLFQGAAQQDENGPAKYEAFALDARNTAKKYRSAALSEA